MLQSNQQGWDVTGKSCKSHTSNRIRHIFAQISEFQMIGFWWSNKDKSKQHRSGRKTYFFIWRYKIQNVMIGVLQFWHSHWHAFGREEPSQWQSSIVVVTTNHSSVLVSDAQREWGWGREELRLQAEAEPQEQQGPARRVRSTCWYSTLLFRHYSSLFQFTNGQIQIKFYGIIWTMCVCEGNCSKFNVHCIVKLATSR